VSDDEPETSPSDALAGIDLSIVNRLPVAEQAAAYAGLHDRLQQALMSLDEL